MYVILIDKDNSMITTQKQRIIQRSKLVDELCFLTAPTYNGYNMADFTVLLEYVLPVSRAYKNEILVRSEDYKDYLRYMLPIDTELTLEAGDVEIKISFILSELDSSGRSIQRVRKISGTTITILPIESWCDVIPDSSLEAIDQLIIRTDAQIKALDQLATFINENKADDFSYDRDSGEFQLLSGNTPIGRKMVITRTDESDNDNEEGSSGVDTNNPSDGDTSSDDCCCSEITLDDIGSLFEKDSNSSASVIVF